MRRKVTNEEAKRRRLKFLRKPADLDSLANVVEGIVQEYLCQAVSQFEFGEPWRDEQLRQLGPENSATR